MEKMVMELTQHFESVELKSVPKKGKQELNNHDTASNSSIQYSYQYAIQYFPLNFELIEEYLG
ncbi:hypothetical protein ACFSCX_10880 [Bacillus salitolerans]|uniref:Uncharacterized protein n=1 Tax=Bacillus salitolerans TaxID=1437434 RepID=A0ABW4LPF4_9BACI